MTREEFIAIQSQGLDDVFALTDGESKLRKQFVELTLDTYDFLTSVGEQVLRGFRLSGESSENYFGRKRGAPSVPEALDRRWRSWNAEFPKLLDRNPRLALMYALTAISESHDASSWPSGYERRIQSWVDAGNPAAPSPFDDRYGIVTPGFFERLRTLRQLAGGWLYWDDDVNRVVFAAEPEWQKVRAKQEAAEAARNKARTEEKIRLARMQERLDEVMALARGDVAFWERLKRWELECEASSLHEKPQPLKPLSGPIRAVARQMTPEEKHRSENPPLDPVFVEFVDRVQLPNDPLSRLMIVGNLRGEIRRELGLTGSYRW